MNEDLASDSQVTVKPSVPDIHTRQFMLSPVAFLDMYLLHMRKETNLPNATAICLHSNLVVSQLLLLGPGLHAKTRGVGVSPKNCNSISSLVAPTNGKGNQRRVIATEEVALPGREDL